MGEPLEVSDDLVTQDESFRVISVVGETWKAHRPVRCNQAKAVPAAAPGLTDLFALEHQVIDARGHELAADRQPSLARTDDHDLCVAQRENASPAA